MEVELFKKILIEKKDDFIYHCTDGYQEWFNNENYSEVLEKMDYLYNREVLLSIIKEDPFFLKSKYLEEYLIFWLNKDKSLIYEILSHYKDKKYPIKFDISSLCDVSNLQDLKSYLLYTHMIKNRNFKITNYEISQCININGKFIHSLSKNEFISYLISDDNLLKSMINEDKEILIYDAYPLFDRLDERLISDFLHKDSYYFNLLLPYKKTNYKELNNKSVKKRWSFLKKKLTTDDVLLYSHVNEILGNFLNQEDNVWDIDIKSIVSEINEFISSKDDSIYYDFNIMDNIYIYSRNLLFQINKFLIENKKADDCFYLFNTEKFINNILWVIILNNEKNIDNVVFIARTYNIDIYNLICINEKNMLAKRASENINLYLYLKITNQDINIKNKFSSEEIILKIIEWFKIGKNENLDLSDEHIVLLKIYLDKLPEDKMIDVVNSYPCLYEILDDNIKHNKRLYKKMKNRGIFIPTEINDFFKEKIVILCSAYFMIYLFVKEFFNIIDKYFPNLLN